MTPQVEVLNFIDDKRKLTYRTWVENNETGIVHPSKFDIIPNNTTFDHKGQKVLTVAYLERPHMLDGKLVQGITNVYMRSVSWLKDVKAQIKKDTDICQKAKAKFVPMID